ncbi:MAG TPA: hypothetical protein VGI80_07695 [Pyrinomonadaceae bacterium]|jgi:hypothetical protein
MGERRWQRFEEAAARKGRDAVRVSVNPVGEITFDVETYRRMGEPQAMFLLYEPETQTIGIEPGNADEPSSVLVRTRHARSNRVVRSMSFFKKHGILPLRTVVLPFAYIEGNVLVLDMRTAVAYGSGWKKVERAEARRRDVAEVRAERERTSNERSLEKERLKAERHQLSQEKMRLRKLEQDLETRARQRERELIRARRDWEMRHPSENLKT